jgi:oligopeptide/dipeptide ABC transporter ATP-binding protein
VLLTTPLLDVRDMSIEVYSGGEWVKAIDRASFRVGPGEVLALVGESASGKSLMALGGVDLLGAGARISGGMTFFEGTPLQAIEDDQWRQLVGMGIGVLFQDPIGSWDPVETIGQQSGEVLEEHTGLTSAEINQRVLDSLGEVKLPRQRKFLSFPQQMSRGEAQRAMLASVLLSSPALLIADEPVTGLDATVAAAVLSLIQDLVRRRRMGLLLVTHDLGVVARMADRVAVVYGGMVVEEGPVGPIFRDPKHPYTDGLLRSIPWPGLARLEPIPGEAPHITMPPPGCVFWPRCAYAESGCRAGVPGVETMGPTRVRCRRAWGLELPGITPR